MLRSSASKSGSRLRAYLRVDTPHAIASSVVSIQRVPVGGKDEARQRELAGGASCPKPTDLDAASSERHLRTRAARTDRLPLGVLLPLRTAAGVPVVLHQHAQHLLAHADTQVEQGTLPVYERPPERAAGSGRRRSSETRRLGDERTDWHAWPWWLLPFGWHHLRNTRRRKEPPLSAFSSLQLQQPPGHPLLTYSTPSLFALINRSITTPCQLRCNRDGVAGTRQLSAGFPGRRSKIGSAGSSRASQRRALRIQHGGRS